MTPRIDVLGVAVSAIAPDTALSRITEWVNTGAKEYVCVTGVHGVMESQRDPGLLSIHNSSGLTTPDGMPLVWCARYAGVKTVDRVYGPELMLQVAEASVHLGWSHFLYGAAPGVPERVAANLQQRFPGLKIAGTHSPPFRDLTEEEERSIVDEINGSKADIVWVGLSTPKQERWMAKLRPALNAPVLIGVGAAFDIHAGNVPQAPQWVQRAGMEWSYRLIKEPRRLWRRYLRNNPEFIARILTRPPRLIETAGVELNGQKR